MQGWSRFPREAHRAKGSQQVVAFRWEVFCFFLEVSIEIDSGHSNVAVRIASWFVEICFSQVTRNVAPLDGQRFMFVAQAS